MGSFYMDINDRYVCRYKESWQRKSNETSMEKREDEATSGDGVVTMRHMKKNVMEQKLFACKGHMAVRPGKACIPLVTHR